MVGLTLSLSPQLELRQSLLAQLQASLVIKQTTKLIVAQYLNREDICTKLYAKALSQGKVVEYNKHDMCFEYALVSKADVPKFIWEQTGHAFSHCLMDGFECLIFGAEYARSRGSWLLFVIEDFFCDPPREVTEFAAIHERGEMVTLGRHELATKLEFAIAKTEGVLDWYMEWIEQNYPEKFADVFAYQTHTVLPPIDDLENLMNVFQKSAEAQIVTCLIEGFEWPETLLEHLMTYKKANEAVIGIINQAIYQASQVCGYTTSYIQLLESLEIVLTSILKEIITGGHAHYLSIIRVQDSWITARRELSNAFDKALVTMKTRNEQAFLNELPTDFDGMLPKTGVFSLEFDKILKHLQ